MKELYRVHKADNQLMYVDDFRKTCYPVNPQKISEVENAESQFPAIFDDLMLITTEWDFDPYETLIPPYIKSDMPKHTILFGLCDKFDRIVLKPIYSSITFEDDLIHVKMGSLECCFSCSWNYPGFYELRYHNEGAKDYFKESLDYDFITSFKNDLAIFIKDCYIGLLDNNYKSIIDGPFVLSFSNNIRNILGIYNNTSSVALLEAFELPDADGNYNWFEHYIFNNSKLVGHCTNSHYQQIIPHTSSEDVFIVKTDKNRFRVIKSDFSILSKEYDEIISSNSDNFFIVVTQSKYGIIKRDDNDKYKEYYEFVKCSFDYIQTVIRKGITYFEIHDRCYQALITLSGETLIDFNDFKGYQFIYRTIGENFIGMEKYFNKRRDSLAYFWDIENSCIKVFGGESSNLKIMRIINGFIEGKAKVIHYGIPNSTYGDMYIDIINKNGDILSREPYEEPEIEDWGEQGDVEWTEQDEWDAMTDGTCGERPESFDDDYYFLGY